MSWANEDVLRDLFGGSLFGEDQQPTQRFGFVQPKHESLLPVERRLRSRVACNDFIFRTLAEAR